MGHLIVNQSRLIIILVTIQIITYQMVNFEEYLKIAVHYEFVFVGTVIVLMILKIVSPHTDVL